MNVNTPSLDAAEHYEARQAVADATSQAWSFLRGEFLALVEAGDLDAVATFEPTRTNWRVRLEGGGYAVRPTTLLDLLYDREGERDFDRRLMEVLIRAASGAHVQEDARELIEDMADHYAETSVDA